MNDYPMPEMRMMETLRRGTVIPAHPLGLTETRELDERHQRALTRYYLHAGVGGLAVGVHTTQFEIHDPAVGLYRPVLELAGEEMDAYEKGHNRRIVRIAGIIGKTDQARREAGLAAGLGYDAALMSLAAFPEASNREMLAHCRSVAEVIPLVGFYLQPAVGGRHLDRDFWCQFAAIPNVIAIKVAPFNRYETLDVFRGVAASGRANEIALYTGNDDNILMDLLTPVTIDTGDEEITMRFVGGLLGHWAVWTKRAVELLERVHRVVENGGPVPGELLSLGPKITDCNAAVFDVDNDFEGVIVGIHEVLRRQGLMWGTWTLNPEECLSNAQRKEIDRVIREYPELTDDGFVEQNLDRWLSQ